MHLDIAKYLNIAKRIFENIKLSIKDRSWKVSENKCTEVLSGSLFVLTRPGSVAHALLSQTLYSLDIAMFLGIAKYSNIAKQISKSIDLRRKNKDW